MTSIICQSSPTQYVNYHTAFHKYAQILKLMKSTGKYYINMSSFKHLLKSQCTPGSVQGSARNLKT